MYISKKTIICIVLSIWFILMAVVFAIYQERLAITGTSHIDSRWDIRITNITTNDIVGDATEKTAPSYTDTTARLHVSLINPTDSITYNIKIKNNGTLSARVSNYTVTMGDSDAIIYEVKGLLKDQVLEPNEEQTVKIKITFKPGYIGDPSSANKTSTVKVVIDYVQNLDGEGASGEGETITNNYTPYSIGDIISFAGSNWYVIEDSSSSQDYVTLLKQNVLTGAEIGANYVSGGNTSINSMAYYWSSTCHYSATYGSDTYSSTDFSGCAGHNDYAGSKIKEVVDNYMTTNNMTNDLTEADGYKIRLITTDELINNLGWAVGSLTYATDSGNVPVWFYTNYGSSSGFWTMTPNQTDRTWRVHNNNSLYHDRVDYGYSVRPVINLYKSAIE